MNELATDNLIDESSANKGNAVNMAKNILKGFMEYVMVSAKDSELFECCSSTGSTQLTAAI